MSAANASMLPAPPPAGDDGDELVVLMVAIPRRLLSRSTAEIRDFVNRALETRLRLLAGKPPAACASDRDDCGCGVDRIAEGLCDVFTPDGQERVP